MWSDRHSRVRRTFAVRVVASSVAVLMLLTGCGGGGSDSPTPAPATQRGDLVSVESTTPVNVATIDAIVTALATFGVDTTALAGTRYAVSLNRIRYKTLTPDGRLVDASGVVVYPVKIGGPGSPLLSFQHATILDNNQAPSEFTGYGGEMAPVVALAARGFIVAMPDYIGYAASASEIHPYVHQQGLAASIIDMLRATRQLLSDRGVPVNTQLFLTGYSEGGYATLAAQKEIEQNLSGEFAITASMPAAGPYDMAATAQYIVGQADNPEPKLVAFVFKAYDRWYGWNRLAEIFQAPYAASIAAYQNDGNYLQDTLTTDPTMLFTTAFRTAFLGSGETAVKAAFTANNLYDWAPSAPTRLFHGPDDTTVPYFNAVNTVTAMTIAGSMSVTQVDCTTPSALIPRDHVNCVPDYLTQAIEWFIPLATGL